MSLKLKELLNSFSVRKGNYLHLENEGITRDVIENKRP
jgi:hypothetical protein